MKARAGFTLIEVLVVMAGLAAATGLLAVVMGGALRLDKTSAGTLQRLRAQQALADQFRADVAQAVDAPQRWREDVAGPTCLILLLGEGRHVVYRWDTNRLMRFEVAGEKTRRQEVALGGGPAAVQFARSSAGGRLLTLKLFIILKNGSKEPSVEITAALGGDLQ